MNELPLFAIIMAGGAGVIIFIFIMVLRMQQSDYAYAILYGNLLDFKYWISNCEISKANHTTTLARIWQERTRPQASIPEYADLIHEITYIFIKRFADFIQERGSKNNE